MGMKTALTFACFVVAFIAMSSCSSLAVAQAPRPAHWGVVRSTDGRLLAKVWVQELGARRGRETEAGGDFDLPVRKPASLLFFKPGFRPQIRVTTGSEGIEGLTVVLEPEARADLNLRPCTGHRWPLPELRAAKVRGLEVRRGRNIEYASYDATYKYGGSVRYLSSRTGIHQSCLTPTPGWVAGLSSFTVRSLSCGGDQWFDLHGVTETGLESRWVGDGGGCVEYSKVPALVARVFDQAIDNGCCTKVPAGEGAGLRTRGSAPRFRPR